MQNDDNQKRRPKHLGLFLLGKSAFEVGLEDGDIDLMLKGCKIVRTYGPDDTAIKPEPKNKS
jgi:hypothetical protein